MAVVDDLGRKHGCAQRGLRASAAAGSRGRAVGAGRHAAEQGRDRRCAGEAPAQRLLSPGAPERLRRHPGSLRPGEPADAVTVAAELDRRGLLRRIGGAPYVHTLISMVPTAANAGSTRRSSRRRRCCAGWWKPAPGWCSTATRCRGRRRSRGVDRAQAEMYEVTDVGSPRISSRWKICCSRRWMRSTRSRPTAVWHVGCRPGSPNSTR